jgi:Ca-activated chloride channel family protein
MRFDNYIYLIILVIYLAYLFLRRKKAKKKSASFFFSSIAPFSIIKQSTAVKISNNVKFLKTAALIMILVALARPQLLDVQRNSDTFGIDIVLALDVSGSMQAEDFKPKNRLFVAKEVLKEFISGRRVDRLSLVVFAGKSYTQSPLTTDYSILLNLLDEVDINYTDEGTAIGLALSESLNRLKNSSAKSKVIILLTDGENNKGNIDPILAAKLAKALDVKVYTIGIGTGEGVPVPIGGGVMGDKEFAKASDGSVVITKLNEDVMKNIAQTTGGLYYRATSKEALLQIYAKIGEMEKSKIELKEYLSYYELFPFFAFSALFLLFLEILMTTTRYNTFP